LPTSSFGINRALGGRGLSSGRIHLYWGLKASGKTTLTLQQIARAQREGKTCAYIDSEKAWTPEWAEKNGVDLDAIMYRRGNSAEELLEGILPDLASEKIDLLVVDSLNSINFDAFFDPDKNPMGSYARSGKMFTHKMLNALGTQTHIILLSHAAMDLSGTYPVMKAAVGNAIDHWASTIIKFQKLGGKDAVREDGAFKTKWKIEKSKQSVYPVEGHYWFNPLTARIDNVAEIVSAGIEAGMIDKSGAWFYLDKGLETETKFHGENALVEAIRTNPEFAQTLNDTLMSIPVIALQEDDSEMMIG
jgi:recombination protein RecA